MDQRNQELDFIRAAAILLVIFQHAWSMLGLDEPSTAFTYHGYRALIYGVPLFVMLSGYLQIRHPMPAGPYLKKRFSRILPPFLLWAVVVYAISVFMHRYGAVSGLRDALVQFVPFLLTNKINAAYWYVFMLAGLYLVTPVLHAAFEAAENRKKLLEYCLLIWIAISALGDVYPACSLVTYFPIVGYLGYYLLGYYLCLYADGRKLNLRIGAIGFPLAYGLNVGMMYLGYTLVTLEILEISCLFLLLKSVRIKSEPVMRRVCDISRYSYGIYLTHFVLIAFCYSAFPKTFDADWATPVEVAILVLGVECVFFWLLDRIRFIPGNLVGISGQKKR